MPQQPDQPAAVAVSAVMSVPVEYIRAGVNARGDVGDVGELAQSMAALGQQEPCIFIRHTDTDFEVFEGHRRLKAARQLGAQRLLGTLRAPMTPAERLVRQVAMHAQARDFDPMAQARAIQTLMDDHGVSQKLIAAMFGKSVMWVSTRTALLVLPPAEQDRVATGELCLADAVEMAREIRAAESGKDRRRTAPPPARTPHFTSEHPLAATAAELCTAARHRNRVIVGSAACGECWEAAIRADAKQPVLWLAGAA